VERRQEITPFWRISESQKMKKSTKVRAELKSLYSPDADPLENFMPTGSFGILVMAMIGPAGQEGHESFDFMVCSPEWFSSNMRQEIKPGRHHLFVRDFSYPNLEKFVRNYCNDCGEAAT